MNSVFITILRWEWRALRRDSSFWIAGALMLIALGFALHAGTAWRDRLSELGASAARVDSKIAADARALAAELDRAPNPLIIPTRDPRNPYGFAHFQMQHTIALPPTPLASLTTGQSDLLPQTLTLNPGTPPSRLGTAEPENPHRLLIGPFDVSFVVVSLLPLVVIALTYGLIAGERERGMLPLLLTQPIALSTLVAGRLLPRVLLVAGLLAMLALGGAPDALLSSRGALWLTVALAYGAFWFGVSLAVITRRGTSATHALVLAAIWIATVVLVPAGINLAVKTLHPVPSRVELILAARQATDEISGQTSKLLAAYYEDHPEFAPKPNTATEYSEVRFITNERLDRALEPVLARYEARLARQQSLVEKLQYFSPALLAQSALAEAAGTGLTRHREFMRQAAQHHADLRAFFNPRILRKERFTAWDEVPLFRFAEESPAAVGQRLLPAILALVVLTAALTIWSFRSLNRTFS